MSILSPVSSFALTEAKLAMVGAAFEKLVKPSLVPIFGTHTTRPNIPVQIGTGFLVVCRSRPVLITAKHVLRGASFREQPGEKAVLIEGKFVHFKYNSRILVEPQDHDLIVTYMDELSVGCCLPRSAISPLSRIPNIITFCGFLARDFERRGEELLSAPRHYTNLGLSIG